MISPKPIGVSPDDSELTPEEERAWQAGVERVEIEKRRALENPGPSWREWFLYDNAKWWVGLGFLIVDIWLGGSWVSGTAVSPLSWVGLVLSLLLAVYLEFLLWGYLWRRPTDAGPRRYRRFRPSWRGLREFGLWTPESAQLRKGSRGAVTADGAPNPDEFL